MLFRVDPTSGVPLFEQVASSVRAEVASGRLGAGERLPSAKEVAAAVGVNLHTVLHAYQLLRDEGLLDLRRGRGAVVTDRAIAIAGLRSDVAALVDRAAALGVTPDTLAALVKETSRDR